MYLRKIKRSGHRPDRIAALMENNSKMVATVRRAVQDGHQAAALRRGTRAVGMGRKARCRVAASCTSPGRKNLR
ncbi:protein of unknown function [Acidithiobacillus ferrivorans]|uniref:Transposase n=1 Tax=Acidithiobacillus ferrivorans TaxID=160808 RepID=A0ABY1MKC7_9PROT|nr:protein of unknown function [Acidithiobacillus ferrivorans]